MGLFTKFKNKITPSLWCDVVGYDNEENPWACDLQPGHPGKHAAEIYVGNGKKRIVIITPKEK